VTTTATAHGANANAALLAFLRERERAGTRRVMP